MFDLKLQLPNTHQTGTSMRGKRHQGRYGAFPCRRRPVVPAVAGNPCSEFYFSLRKANTQQYSTHGQTHPTHQGTFNNINRFILLSIFCSKVSLWEAMILYVGHLLKNVLFVADSLASAPATILILWRRR